MKLFRRKFSQKGLVLITTMLLLTIIIMICTLLATSASNSLKMSVNFSDGEQAGYAALSGLEYARLRIYQDPTWMQSFEKPSSPGNISIRKSFTLGDLKIDERNDGVVVGYFGYNGSSYRSKFIISFSRDSASESDYVSCNNLLSSKASETFLLKNGKLEKYKSVPKNMMCLIVKGVANRSVKYAQGFADISGYAGSTSSSLARKDISLSLDSFNSSMKIRSKDGSGGEIRTLGNVAVSSYFKKNCLDVADGTVHAADIKMDRVNISLQKSSTKIPELGINIDLSDSSLSRTDELLSEYGSVTFDSLTDNSGRVSSLEPGGYIYCISEKKWFFSSDFKVANPDSPALYVGNSIKELNSLGGGNYRFSSNGEAEPCFEISGKVSCNGSLFLGVTEKLSPSNGSILLSCEKNIRTSFTGSSPSLELTASSDGIASNLIVQGYFSGHGAVYSTGNVFFQGSPYFGTAGNEGVSVYADGNIGIIPSTGTIDNGIESYVKGVWDVFLSRKINSSNENEAAAELLRTVYDGISLKQKLEELKCADPFEYAKTMISKNSTLVGDGIDGTAFESVNEYNEGQINMSLATAISGKYLEGYPSEDPGYSYKWEAGNGSRRGATVNLIKGAIIYYEANTETANLDSVIPEAKTEIGNFIEIWVHDGHFASDNTDFYVYVPLNSNNEVDKNGNIRLRFGINRIPSLLEENKTAYSGLPASMKDKYEVEAVMNSAHPLTAGNFLSENSYDNNSVSESFAINFKSLMEQAGAMKVSRINPDLPAASIDRHYFVEGSGGSPSLASYKYGKYKNKNVTTNGNNSFNVISEAMYGYESTGSAMNGDLSRVKFKVYKEKGGSVKVVKKSGKTVVPFPAAISGTGKSHLVFRPFLADENIINANDTMLRGMFLAGNNFTSSGGGGSINIEGAVISRNGGFKIYNTDVLGLYYNPDYMEFTPASQKAISRYVFRAVF